MKYIIDHTGICAGIHFEAGRPVELPDSAAFALGAHAKPVENTKTSVAATPKQPEEVKQPEQKEAKQKKDKMVRKAKAVTK